MEIEQASRIADKIEARWPASGAEE